MNWITALLAALAVLQAGVGVCTSPAHAAAAGEAVTGSTAQATSDHPCHETGPSMDEHNAHPAVAAGQEFAHQAGDAAMDCCTSGACADCALVVGALASADAATPGLAPMIKAARVPEAPLGRPMTHDPPPPRA